MGTSLISKYTVYLAPTTAKNQQLLSVQQLEYIELFVNKYKTNVLSSTLKRTVIFSLKEYSGQHWQNKMKDLSCVLLTFLFAPFPEFY